MNPDGLADVDEETFAGMWESLRVYSILPTGQTSEEAFNQIVEDGDTIDFSQFQNWTLDLAEKADEQYRRFEAMGKAELLAEVKRMYGLLRQQDKQELQQLTKDEDFLNLQLELQAERDARNALENRVKDMPTTPGVTPDTPESHAQMAQAVDRSISKNLQEQTEKLTAEIASLKESLQQAEDDMETAAQQAELTETSLKDEVTRLEHSIGS